jgi:hypothetical protein
MNQYIDKPIEVDFENLALDPNNPRLGRPAPGYDEPSLIFADTTQQEIHEEIKRIYEEFDELKDAILAQGWTPIDAILVWKHHRKNSHYIVVEGNTRKTALRQIREDLKELEAEKVKLVKRKADKDIIDAKNSEILRHKEVVSATDRLTVVPVKAKDSKELEMILPRILGVRHIKHPRQWGPYPQNLFILREYEKRFKTSHGSAKLFIDDGIVREVAALVSEDPLKTRRGIQSAFAFGRFVQRWSDKLPPGDDLEKADHYFFELILQNKYAKAQFRLDDHKLELDSDMEAVLFKWAFSQPRKGQAENRNILYKAENIRFWNTMAGYDTKHKTGFAAQLDTSNPTAAPLFKQLEAHFLDYQASQAPTNLLTKLIAELKKLTAESLMHGTEHLKVQLDQVVGLATKCQQMIDSVGGKGTGKKAK